MIARFERPTFIQSGVSMVAGRFKMAAMFRQERRFPLPTIPIHRSVFLDCLNSNPTRFFVSIAASALPTHLPHTSGKGDLTAGHGANPGVGSPALAFASSALALASAVEIEASFVSSHLDLADLDLT